MTRLEEASVDLFAEAVEQGVVRPAEVLNLEVDSRIIVLEPQGLGYPTAIVEDAVVIRATASEVDGVAALDEGSTDPDRFGGAMSDGPEQEMSAPVGLVVEGCSGEDLHLLPRLLVCDTRVSACQSQTDEEGQEHEYGQGYETASFEDDESENRVEKSHEALHWLEGAARWIV